MARPYVCVDGVWACVEETVEETFSSLVVGMIVCGELRKGRAYRELSGAVFFFSSFFSVTFASWLILYVSF